jgi:hypothetical protein
MSIAARRLKCPLPATSYNPTCENNFHEEFRADVSNRELKSGKLYAGAEGVER